MPLSAKAPPPPGGWQAWAQAVIQHLPGITSMPLTEEEVSCPSMHATHYKPPMQLTMRVSEAHVLLVPLDFEAAEAHSGDARSTLTLYDITPEAGSCGCGVLAQLNGVRPSVLQCLYQVLAFGPEARQQYLQYCRQHMFAGQPTVPTFEDIQRILLGWYDATVAQGSTPAAAVATDGPSAQQASQCQAAEPTPATQSGSGQRLEAGFASDTSNYSLLLLGSSAAPGSYRLEPQLAAVVLAVTAYSRCSPTALLDCVRVIEKQMLSVEAGVKLLRHSSGVSL